MECGVYTDIACLGLTAALGDAYLGLTAALGDAYLGPTAALGDAYLGLTAALAPHGRLSRRRAAVRLFLVLEHSHDVPGHNQL